MPEPPAAQTWPASVVTWSGWRANRAGQLELGADRIAVGARSISRRDLRCELVKWKQPPLWTTLGSALVLTSSDGTLAIGGRDHFVRETPAGSTHQVDASLSPGDFVAFASALGVEPNRSGAATNADAVTIDLVPSTTSILGALGRIRWWIATMAAAGTFGFLAERLGLLETDAGRIAVQVTTGVLVLGGLAATIRSEQRPPPCRYRLIVASTSVTLCDDRAGGAPIDPSVVRPEAEPRTYRSTGRYGTTKIPAVRLEWPSHTMVVGSWNTSRWPEGVRRTYRLQYLIGPEEWRRLLRALGLD